MSDFPQSPDYVPPTFHPLCALCVRKIHPHEHPDGLRPVWPCLSCHDGHHDRCDVTVGCSCWCGLRVTLRLIRTEGEK